MAKRRSIASLYRSRKTIVTRNPRDRNPRTGKPWPKKRRNVAAGFYDEDGYFHPIRASYDYDAGRTTNPRRKRKNAPKMIKPPKGWIKAKAVRVVRRGGKRIVEVKR